MKPIVFLLIFLNVAFFLWETRSWYESRPYRELAMPASVEPIELAQEAADTGESDPEGDEVPPNALDLESAEPDDLPKPEAAFEWPPKLVDCFRIGPSQNRGEADFRLELLKGTAPDIAVEMRPGDVPDGWWVLFPKSRDQEAADQNRRMLTEKGVKDAWVFDAGPLQWAISLGLYQERKDAEAAQKPLMAKNIVTEVVPRMVRGNVYWLKIPWHRPALELEEIIQVLNTQDPSLHIPQPVACE